jgi:hypothetical protein
VPARRAHRLLAFGAIALGCACTPHAGVPASRVTRRAAKPLHRGPLTDYVAEAGLRWMIVGRPGQILENSELSRALQPLIPKAGLDAFRVSTGLDLRKTSSALVAGFDYGLLYAATTPSGNALVEERFVERVVSGAIRKDPRPELSYISGVVGTTPEAMVSIDHQFVAIAVGDPTPARVVAAFALGQLKRTQPALHGAALSTLPIDLTRAPVRFYAPGPLPPAWVGGAHGLLGSAQAVGASAEPGPAGTLKVRVVLSGNFAKRGPEAEQRLLATWKDLGQSNLGRLIGLNDPSAPPTVAVRASWIELDVSLKLSTLVEGLRAVVSDDVRQMLHVPPAPTGPSR